MSWLAGWGYRKTVTITGQAGAGTNYQVDFSIAESAGGDFNLESHCTSFPNDIQVTDNDQTTPLDYWVEDLTVDPITMWVEVADDLSSNADVCVYYGKSGEGSASDITDTFMLGDDFNDNSIDASKWNVTERYGMTVQETNQEIKLSGTKTVTNWYDANITAVNSLSGPRIVQVKAKIVSGTQHFRDYIRDGSARIKFYSNNGIANVEIWGNTDSGEVFLTDCTADTWYDFKIVFDGTDKKLYVDDTYYNIYTDTTDGNIRLDILQYESGSSGDVRFNDVIARKYNNPEPAYLSASGEEEPPSGMGRLVYGGLVNDGLVHGRLVA